MLKCYNEKQKNFGSDMRYWTYPDCIQGQNTLKFKVYAWSFSSFVKKKQMKKKFFPLYLYNHYNTYTLGGDGDNK